jgi:hypothetical protein
MSEIQKVGQYMLQMVQTVILNLQILYEEQMAERNE